MEAVLSGQLLTGESGSFESPNYPTADHQLDYVWLIKVGPTKTVRLVLIDFDTETGFDYIIVSSLSFPNPKFHQKITIIILRQVHDGDSTEHPMLLVHSGNSVPPPIRSTSHKMLVRFITNNKGTSRGFHANFFAVKFTYVWIWTLFIFLYCLFIGSTMFQCRSVFIRCYCVPQFPIQLRQQYALRMAHHRGSFRENFIGILRRKYRERLWCHTGSPYYIHVVQ